MIQITFQTPYSSPLTSPVDSVFITISKTIQPLLQLFSMHAILSSPPDKLLLQNISFAVLSSNKNEKKRGQFQTCLNTTGNLLIHNRELGFKVLAAQSSLALYYSMDCSPPCSSVHGILQARIQEWVAIPFSRRSS